MNQIQWTDEAKETYATLLNYSMENYPLDFSIRMNDSLERILDLLQFNRNLCPPSEKIAGVRKCTFTKLLSMAYRISDNEIQILAFVDNRMQHPF